MSYARIGSLRHSAAEDDDDCSLAQRGPAPIPKLLIPRLLGHGPRRRAGSAPGPGREQDWARNLSRQRWEAGTLLQHDARPACGTASTKGKLGFSHRVRNQESARVETEGVSTNWLPAWPQAVFHDVSRAAGPERQTPQAPTAARPAWRVSLWYWDIFPGGRWRRTAIGETLQRIPVSGFVRVLVIKRL